MTVKDLLESLNDEEIFYLMSKDMRLVRMENDKKEQQQLSLAFIIPEVLSYCEEPNNCTLYSHNNIIKCKDAEGNIKLDPTSMVNADCSKLLGCVKTSEVAYNVVREVYNIMQFSRLSEMEELKLLSKLKDKKEE